MKQIISLFILSISVNKINAMQNDQLNNRNGIIDRMWHFKKTLDLKAGDYNCKAIDFNAYEDENLVKALMDNKILSKNNNDTKLHTTFIADSFKNRNTIGANINAVKNSVKNFIKPDMNDTILVSLEKIVCSVKHKNAGEISFVGDFIGRIFAEGIDAAIELKVSDFNNINQFTKANNNNLKTKRQQSIDALYFSMSQCYSHLSHYLSPGTAMQEDETNYYQVFQKQKKQLWNTMLSGQYYFMNKTIQYSNSLQSEVKKTMRYALQNIVAIAPNLKSKLRSNMLHSFIFDIANSFEKDQIAQQITLSNMQNNDKEELKKTFKVL